MEPEKEEGFWEDFSILIYFEEYGENTVGITEFLSPGVEIKGSVKYRWK